MTSRRSNLASNVKRGNDNCRGEQILRRSTKVGHESCGGDPLLGSKPTSHEGLWGYGAKLEGESGVE
jgi:hypothetical protein